MATKSSIQHLRRGATALTNETGKLIRDGALSAAHQALVLALQSVKAADRKLRAVGQPRRKATGRAARAVRHKATRSAAKLRGKAAGMSKRSKPARRRRATAR